MNVADVRERVADIAAVAGDEEVAHGMEDDLWRDVLLAVAAGAENAHELAAEALKMRGYDFARWCA